MSTELIAETIAGGIRDFAAKVPLMYNAVRKTQWPSQVYFILKRTALPSSVWSTDGGPLPSPTHEEYVKQEAFPVKYLYTRGEVTGPLIAAAASQFDALARTIESHTQSMVEQLSTDIITGDGSNGSFFGILHQSETDSILYTAAGGAGQVVDADGDYLSMAWLDEAIDASAQSAGTGVAGPGATAIVTTNRVRRAINGLLREQQVFNDKIEVAAGFRVTSYDGLPILVDNHWQDDTKILFVDLSQAELLVHKDFTYEELAKTRDSVDFMIKWYGGFALNGAASELTNFVLPA
jgi:hypothetical protein